MSWRIKAKFVILRIKSFILSNTISKRFIASLLANIFRGGLSFLTGLLLARWMGPSEYGRMSFLLTTFIAVRLLLDMASSSAFFTFLSQRQRSKKFVLFFGKWLMIQFLFFAIIIGLLLPGKWLSGIWHSENRGLLVLAFAASFIQSTVWPVASQMAEAQRETVRVQWLNAMVIVVHLIVVLFLWLFGQLFIPMIFAAIVIEWILASWFAARMYRGHTERGNEKDSQVIETDKTILKEYWVYCMPFIPYTILSFFHDFADRWMLQTWGGSKEQAYFSVAYQFTAIALLATTSILRILWKEVAEAHHNGNIERVGELYNKASKSLYFISALIAGALIPWSKEIIQLTLGKAYAAGYITMMLMFLYPIHQSVGQINGTVLYATSKNRLQVTLGVCFMLSSLCVSYFMLAPKKSLIPGLGLASLGLAWKMVMMQAINVNIARWIICRSFKWKYEWAYQLIGLGITVGIGWIVKLIIFYFMYSNVILCMLISLIIYFSLLVLFIYKFPRLIGLQIHNISEYTGKIMHMVRGVYKNNYRQV